MPSGVACICQSWPSLEPSVRGWPRTLSGSHLFHLPEDGRHGVGNVSIMADVTAKSEPWASLHTFTANSKSLIFLDAIHSCQGFRY